MDDVSSKYRSGKNFPDRRINPKLKLSKDYARQICEAIYSTYINDKCGIPYSLMSAFQEVRNYSNGKQNPALYEQYITDNDTSSGVVSNSPGAELRTLNSNRKGTNSISKHILSPAARLKQAIFGSFMDVDYNVVADTIDPDSIYEKERKKSQLYAESRHIDVINYVKQTAGLPVETDTKYPKDLDELKLMDMLGEFKTPIAKAIQKACHHTYDISDWDGTIMKLLDDEINFNRISIKEYFDTEECKWKVRYVDITRLIAQYSDKRDYSDSCFFGEIRLVKIADIRYKLEEAGYSEDDIKQIAYGWCGNGDILSQYGGVGNPAAGAWSQYQSQDSYGCWLYDYWNVLVMETTYLENDNEYKLYKPNSITGEVTVYNGKYGEVKNTDNKKTVVTTVKRWYEATWVVGTNYVYDNMISRSQPFDNRNRRPIPPYHVFIGEEEAITPRCIPIYNDFQITWLKLQNKLQELHNEITMLDMTILDHWVKKGDVNGFLDLLKNIKKTGFLPYRSLPIKGQYGGGNVKPLDKIPSTMLQQIQESIALFENSFRMIEMVTGINPAALGSSPSKGEGLGATEIALANTGKILKPMIVSIFRLKEDSAEFLAEAIRLAVRNDEKAYDAYARVIGMNDVDALKESTYSATELGIKLKPKPTDADIQQLKQELEKVSLPGKNGEPAIRYDVKLYIQEKLMLGADLTDIRLYLSNAIDKEKDRQEQLTQKNIEMQGGQQSQLEQIKAQAAMQQEQLRVQSQIAIDNNAHKNKLEEDWQKISHEKAMKSLDMDMQEKQLNQQQNANAEQQEPSPISN